MPGKLKFSTKSSGDRDDRPPRFTFDKPGDRLAGTVVRKFDGEGDYGRWEAIEVDRGDGDVVTLFGKGQILNDAIAHMAEGDHVDITYQGKLTSAAGRRYHAYEIEVTDGQD